MSHRTAAGDSATNNAVKKAHFEQEIQFDLTHHEIPRKLFIDGTWTDSKAHNIHSLTSAVNDQVICQDLHWADAGDVDQAVDSAARGYAAWQALSKRERRDRLLKYAQLIKEHAEQIHWLEAVVIGKARSFSNFEVDASAEAFICKCFETRRGPRLIVKKTMQV